MLLFKIFYISAFDALTDKEQNFFTQVQGAASDAFNATPTGMTIDEWNNYAFIYITRAQAEKAFNRNNIGTPSVVVLYRASDKEQFKAAYLKGVGAPAAWTAAFKKVFELVPIEVREKGKGDNQDGTKKNGNGGNGTSDGAGGSGWFPFGTRGCGFIDEVLDSLGLTKPLKQLVYGGTALYLGSRALQSGNKAGQVTQGAGAVYFLYLALTDSASGCNQKK